ncbi:uveal autoantigen with coiled-coil domains and ankyrin repeats protein-like isoform X2 [Anguilla rostrata]|uniref:uveal autoantigen with coiled-coil domains and ankyrin repeats protein-like isoform X2 n=1 Tax=Anguilla rostrata TaxID=7938 RepID=UPI0030CDF76A
MKSLKYRLKKHEVTINNTDWNKYDDRLMKAVERGEVDKVAAVLSKKGVVPTKPDVEGRSAFHLAAARGHLDCLNLILGHSVDVTATEATGKNALHLAARNGHSLCVQKLLQHNCPVGNVDLQGRTALHDAVMAGCSSSVKLLCDSGASVNASDFEGRTPLVLATQMCHPRICQLLLERGADISLRDKQNKTALILGCEYACKDAVEVLLKSGADVTAKDSFGHDCFHYARLSKNMELVTLVKSFLDKAAKEREAAKKELKMRQSVDLSAGAGARDQIIHDLEKKNESQQESLRSFHQEHRALLEKLNQLQQQLSQEKSTVEDIQKEREQLRLLLLTKEKEKEEGARAAVETVKVQLKSHMGDYSGQSVIKGKDSVLVKQSHSLDSAQVLQSAYGHTRSASRPLELTREPDTLRRELELARRRQEAAEEEARRLQGALALKKQECEELGRSREAEKRDSDRQVRELEEALGDVQKRMLDSEAKMKQLQAHVVAVKDHLSSQLAEDLKAQLQDVKAKYEGASAEVCRLRNQLKQSEQALEEYKESEGRLAKEEERLSRELARAREEREEMAAAFGEREARAREAEARLASAVPKEKFDNMKNLLTNAVDQKERLLAELREDYDRALEEVAALHRELDGRGTVPLHEHELATAALEEQNGVLKKKLADVTAKSQALILEVEEGEEENKRLTQLLQENSRKLQTQYVPLKAHEEATRALEELRAELERAARKVEQAEAELQRLRAEKGTLNESVARLQTSYVPPERFEREVGALSARSTELEAQLEELRRRCEEKERELSEAAAENAALRGSVKGEGAQREEYEQARAELSAALDRARARLSEMEREGAEREEELRKVREGNATLKEKLEGVEATLGKDYVSLKEHVEAKRQLGGALSVAEAREKEAAAACHLAQEETRKLHQEILEQKKELDTIQEAISSKFIPASVVEEKERSYEAALKELTGQLEEAMEKYGHVKVEGERHKQEKEKLKVEMVSAQKLREAEEAHRSQTEELSRRLREVEEQKRDLEEHSAQCTAEVHSLQLRLETEYVLVEQFEAMKESLSGEIQLAREEAERAAQAYGREAARVAALEAQLQGRSDGAALLAEHARAKEALEKEVARLRVALRQEEESGTKRAEEVAALRSELLLASRAMEEACRGEAEEVAELRAEKGRLEEEATALAERLTRLEEQCRELQEEAARARQGEGRARAEMEALQVKSTSIEREIRELKGRYDDSLSTIGDLQKRIQMSSAQTEQKDKKITELLTDVERLKQALNGLSQLAYAGTAPSKRQTQHIDTLQAQVKSLQQQLADAERQHREVVSIYRTHLLSAAQGHMDEDVQAALLQIIRMRQELVC